MATVTVEQDLPVKMRDGTTLYADVYRPAEPGRYPVLLCRTPYGKTITFGMLVALLNPLRAAQSGYVAIVQDCRGRFASEGEFTYLAQMPQEGPDGYDSVEWAASLPYSNGDVGMFGVSYFGWTQWAAALQRPPHLRAIAPVQSLADYGYGVGHRNGAYELGANLAWHLFVSIDVTLRKLIAAGAPPLDIFGALRGTIAAFDRLSEGGYLEAPLRDLPSLRELGLSNILAYILDRGPGGWSSDYAVAPSAIAIPSFNIGGWFDIFTQGTLDLFTALRAEAPGQGRQASLLIGPWAHGNIGGGLGTTMGEMEFGMAAGGALVDLKGDLTALQLRWFDHWLKGADNGIDKEPPVQVFLTGENRWLYREDWPPAESREQALYLRVGGLLEGSVPPEPTGSSGFTYDPANPAPTLGGNVLMPGVYGLAVKDQRPLSQRADVLTFAGPPLDQPLTVIGQVTADLWVSSSAPDTDFVVRLLDVHPDGYLQNLCDGIIRARYRDSLTEPSWLEPDQVYELKIDLWSLAHVFKPGHKIGLQVTSSSFPRWARNWNTKEDPGAATAGQPAVQTIWHDAAHPSCILLPVMP